MVSYIRVDRVFALPVATAKLCRAQLTRSCRDDAVELPVPGLSALTSIGNSLISMTNNALASLDGFSNLTNVGERVEVQCRVGEGSRRWLAARVLPAVAEAAEEEGGGEEAEEGRLCSLEWEVEEAAGLLPLQLRLAVWRGVNWRHFTGAQ